jgi:Pregnancy-associated plasma protein-A
MKKMFFLLTLLTLYYNLVIAQQSLKCGNYIINENADSIATSFLARGMRSPLVVSRLIRVYFYIVANDDGSQPAATEQEIATEFSQLVNDYAGNNLCFANMGLRYINSTNINFNINCDNPASYAALGPWLVPSCITIFYQRRLGANGGGTYGGNAYAIPNTFCSVATGNINAGRSTSHEVGHCLGLLHTFQSGNENISGNNCSTTGDRVCDTPADPYGRGACFSISGCTYTGTCVDGNGQTNFSPPYSNIMSYYLNNCTINQLTAGQFSRTDGFINTNAGLLSTLSPVNDIVGPITFNSNYGMLSAINNLTTTSNVQCLNDCIVGLAGQKVTLTNGFKASPTTGKVVIRANTCNY